MGSRGRSALSVRTFVWGVYVPIVFSVLFITFGYQMAVNSVDVCKVQIERSLKARFYKSLMEEPEAIETDQLQPPKQEDKNEAN